MTNEEMRVAIAEACGWVRYQFPGGNIQVRWAKWKRPDKCLMADIPDYPNDLNAMAEAERWLRTGGWKGEPMWFNTYLDKLQEVYGDYAIVATAPQRAEAFLKTIGKWKGA